MITFVFGLIFALPLLSALLSCLYDDKDPRLSRFVDFAVVTLSLATSMLAVFGIRYLLVNHVQVQAVVPHVFHGIKYSFVTSRYGVMFLGLVAILYPVAVVYTISYFRFSKINFNKKVLAFMHVSILACFAIALSANMVTSFVFYEIITACTYPLIINPMSKQSRKVGRQYLGYLVGSSSLLVVPTLIILNSVGGTLSFAPSGTLHNANLSKLSVNILFFCMVFGVAKTAVFPMGGWLLKAMVAPAPVSALVHAVVVVKSGLFVMLQCLVGIFGTEFLAVRIYQIEGVNLLSVVALITIFVATIRAISAQHLKERLAYSTVSQAAYSMLMFSLLSKAGVRAGMAQLVAHSLGKITLFFAVGGVYLVNGSYQLKSISSVWRKSPVISFAVTLGCLSVLGLPPTVGFQAKYSIFSALLEDGQVALMVMVVLATFLSSYYIFDIMYHFLFMPKDSNTISTKTKLPMGVVLPIVMLCCFIVAAPNLVDALLFSVI